MQNYKILSLGYNCCVKKYIDTIAKKGPTNLFDYIGSSMWAINKLFENDFQDLFDINMYKNMEIIPNYNVITNEKYYFRFLHDLKTMDNFKKFKESYKRRIIRFEEELNNKNKILFIRLEEPRQDRIIYDQYKEYFQKNELEYLKDFSTIIKTKIPKLNFKIIFISETFETSILEEHNILILKKNNEVVNWDNCMLIFKKLFEENKEIIHKFII